MNDEDHKTQTLAKLTAIFDATDVNGDGKLDLAEYKVFDDAINKSAIDDGKWVETKNQDEDYTNILNAIGEGEGISFAELKAVWGPWMAKFKEL